MICSFLICYFSLFSCLYRRRYWNYNDNQYQNGSSLMIEAEMFEKKLGQGSKYAKGDAFGLKLV